ncbi:MAG: YraN family protein [Reyranellaceae bacterium]
MKRPPGRLERKRRAERYGRSAETLAVLALRLRGYRILARRFRSPQGEIDIVARRGRTLAIVEVKARPDRDGAVLALTLGQRLRIERAAQALVARHPQLAVCDLRFDLMLVGRRRWPRLIADAWRPGMA